MISSSTGDDLFVFPLREKENANRFYFVRSTDLCNFLISDSRETEVFSSVDKM